jgi:myosin-7
MTNSLQKYPDLLKRLQEAHKNHSRHHHHKTPITTLMHLNWLLFFFSPKLLKAKDERNYHIFYCMLVGLSSDERAQLGLTTARDYDYLRKGGDFISCEGRDDAAEFANIRSACKVLTFSDDEIWNILKLLAAIMHIGNIKYKATAINNLDATEITNKKVVDMVAMLLQFSPRDLVIALTTKTIFTSGETVTSTLAQHQSIDVRDAFVKGIYGRLFIWIVDKINAAIYRPKMPGAYRKSIGVLDIFGFENFDNNRYG